MTTVIGAEDDLHIRRIYAYAFRQLAGWPIALVADGAALLEAVAAAPPDLILLDVGLPKLDGIAVYSVLREREVSRTIPVLFVTATPERVARARLEGPHACLPKPFAVEELFHHVGTLLGVPPVLL